MTNILRGSVNINSIDQIIYNRQYKALFIFFGACLFIVMDFLEQIDKEDDFPQDSHKFINL